MKTTLGARIFASHYQLVICDDPSRSIADDENWDDSKVLAGFAGGKSFRVIGTEADLNDHWVELVLDETPVLEEWERVTCVHFRSVSGNIHLMSVVDEQPTLSLSIAPGDYTVYVAGQNLGVDQLSLGEESELSDTEIQARTDLEWYRIFVVSGMPSQVGRMKDTISDTTD